MVSLQSMLLGLTATAAVASASSLSALPTFDVPAFDYAGLTSGDAPQRMLEALQADGIIALKNVPNYANLRERYLREAAQCAAVTANADHDAFVTRKLFDDGTKRATISTNAGRELAGSAAEVDAKCPGYRALYEEFSQTIEHAVNTFGATLDQTAFTASDGHKAISSRKLVSEAVRLDHFHAYEAAPSSPSVDAVIDAETHRQLELSLPLHEDHGLFIAMSAPKFFEVDADGRRLVERELAADASGLVIETSSGMRVRPVLKSDEVVLMMGTGASRWLKTSHALPAVMHGMKMPEAIVSSSEAGRRSLRAWFGKMTLLPAYQRMLESKLPFEEHANRTTRFLLTSQDSDLKTVGCATGRHLAASATSCVVKTCTTKTGQTPPAETCPTVCNRVGHSDTDATECASKCTCTDSASPAEVCWMLCVANLPASQCAVSSQTCSGQQVVCPAGSAPAPTTAAPGTSAPAPGPAPTPAPAPGPGPTTKPSTNAPSSSSPAGSATTTAPAATTTTPGASPSPSTETSSSTTNTADGATTAPPGSASSSSSATPSPNGSTAGSSGSAEPQVSATTSSPSTPASTTAAPTSSASVMLMSSAIATVATVVSTLLL